MSQPPPSQPPGPPQSSQPPAPPPPLEGGRLVLATIAVALATFMNVLDTSIANVAIPTISGDLGVSVDEGTWVITVFAAANAVSIPLTGWLTQRFGQIRLLVASILSFVVASWLCGIAPSLPILLVARVLQGAVAGPLIPLSQAVLLSSWPKEKAASALAFWAMTTTVGPIAGPALGGWITDSYNWSWIFFINIPVGLFAAGVTWSIYRNRESATRKPPIDVVGLGLLVTWVASLQILLDKGKDLDWFNSWVIVGLGITALVSFAFFLVWELTEENPIVDLRLFGQRNFLGGTIAISVAYGVFFGNLVLLPQWMQEYLNYRSVDAGLVTAPLGIFAVLLAPVLGRILPHSDARIIATIAFIGFAIVFYMRSNYVIEIDTWHLVLPTLLQGIPMALFFVPLTAIILAGQPPNRVPAAAGLSNFVRVFCGAVGTSLATNAWNNRTILHHARLTEQASVDNPVFRQQIENLQTTLHLSQASSHAMFDFMLTSQAAMMGLNDIFYVSAIIFLAIIPLIWITRSTKGGGGGAAGAH
ncbi:DHA2 family efflux MFS transporter permease subunit [Paraburkholderia caballeronis]|uniref:MFS transporter, DHA2 family, multidrug resistance protein n=1 Tax=Paraburkholderia caballeronis TaxID=416943 RepID=A0A1H7S7P0_9BURK|nr:DHA2 family efflux MFS transporter permease subunit [Paraburkholderia caballeronis]PXW22936.1 DHA2 family multidrug resistance protein [Paraburkholderia caballeronis]PXW97321.1 DHA2 family multidrug resistance protein [Paraburkholderia caballeronis]RAJ93841.1 DHA2 family multidrug resistance protein [Paraburkholderia caballeronis]SED55836.1 MFS transporter, DHA2 family, multidrug resistance protein [Paraburkholderia caballeronis]SEL68622.1 MFS transporter, DHA2 family, multidrug resistance 